MNSTANEVFMEGFVREIGRGRTDRKDR